MSSLEKRIHDLRAAHLNFKSLVRLLQEGYHFEGREIALIVPQLEKALATLEREVAFLEEQDGLI